MLLNVTIFQWNIQKRRDLYSRNLLQGTFHMKNLSIWTSASPENLCFSRKKADLQSDSSIWFISHGPWALCVQGFSQICAARMPVSRWLWDLKQWQHVKRHQGGYEWDVGLLLTMAEKIFIPSRSLEKKMLVSREFRISKVSRKSVGLIFECRQL